MILDRFDRSDFYAKLHPGFGAAFEFLKTPGIEKLPAGKHPIDGDRLFASVAFPKSVGQEQAKLEVHRRYIDIQVCIKGNDIIGWKPTPECLVRKTEYRADTDIEFFGDAPELWLSLPPHTFAIFLPTDGHAPLAGKMDGDELHKIVMKVAAVWQ